jgi:alanyl-tRNA synthetase
LRSLAGDVLDRIGPGLVVLGAEREGKGSLVGMASPGLIDEGISAAAVVAPGASILGGGGSRDPRLAQAGGPHGERLAEALEAVREAAQQALLGG